VYRELQSYSNKKHSPNWCHTERDSWLTKERGREDGRKREAKQKRRCGRNRAKTVENVAQTIGFVIFSKRKTCCAPNRKRGGKKNTHTTAAARRHNMEKGADMQQQQQQTLCHKDAALQLQHNGAGGTRRNGMESRTRYIYLSVKSGAEELLFSFLFENISSAHWFG